MLRNFISGLTLLLVLSLHNAAQAQSQVNLPDSLFQPLNSVVGAPTVSIISATLTPGQGVLLKWSVVKPTLTQLVKFEVAVNVRYENGKVREGSLFNLGSSLREVTVPVELNTLPVANIKTTIVTRFLTPDTTTDTESFQLSQGASPTQPVPATQVIELTGVSKLSDCIAGKDCFEVRWIAHPNAPGVAGINSYTLKLDVGYLNGQQATSGTLSVSSTKVNIIVHVPKPPHTGAATATATLTAAVTRAGLITTIK